MTEKKGTNFVAQLLGWIGLSLTVLRHYKRLKPDIKTFINSTRTAGRIVAIRAAVIYTEYVAMVQRPVYIGPHDKKKWVIFNRESRIKYTATQLKKRACFKFLFKDDEYSALRKIVEKYITSEEVL